MVAKQSQSHFFPQWTYNISKSYDWNYEHGPQFEGEIPKRIITPTGKFLGFPINSRFGVPAGPLLNSQWISLYAKLGFDILTYKSVRSRSYPAHRRPHMLYLEKQRKTKDFTGLIGKSFPSKYKELAMTNSFGVPSKDPDVWQEDIQKSLMALQKGQLLIVSVMGTQEDAKTEKEFIDDYVNTALLAIDAGAPVIEANFSCPNLHGGGIVCFDAQLVAKICFTIKNAIGNIPLLVKISYFQNNKALEDFVGKTNELIDGYSAINTMQSTVKDIQHKRIAMRHISTSGVMGTVIKPYGLSMVKRLDSLRKEKNLEYSIIGMGGVTSPRDYEEYIADGADIVQAGVGAMMDPLLAYKIYQNESLENHSYESLRSLGEKYFSISHPSPIEVLKKTYFDFLYPTTLSDSYQKLLINKTPFQLKHGERGRSFSHIYLNHRISLFHDKWDRLFLAKLIHAMIQEYIVGFDNSYGVVAIPSSSSPELTALLLDSTTTCNERIIITPSFIIASEQGVHKQISGNFSSKKQWILIDDVFTSGKTMKDSIQLLKTITSSLDNIHAVSLVERNQENVLDFKKDFPRLTTLTSLENILQYHWGKFSEDEKKLIRNERPGLN